jgi:hypothetical protein
MKMLVMLSGATILGLGSLAALAEEPQAPCSLATLRGTYAYAGVSFQNGLAHGGSGIEYHDGHGNLKTIDQGSDGVTSFKSSSTGTYTITPDCIATVIYDGDTADPWTYFVAPDGSVFYYNNNNNHGRVSGGHEDRISRQSLVP